ncbi:MAG: hypothetical protein PF637_04080 [Spirochaetes bacterium]|jgi:hypothetical protein|nr:hypothetical protein [Spirochaetota bacterium]
MVNDQQVRILKNMLQNDKTLKESALCSGMDEKTARKYRDSSKLPRELKKPHSWRTRKDPFVEHWHEPGRTAPKKVLSCSPKHPGTVALLFHPKLSAQKHRYYL